jgi:hypothetical protein
MLYCCAGDAADATRRPGPCSLVLREGARGMCPGRFVSCVPVTPTSIGATKPVQSSPLRLSRTPHARGNGEAYSLAHEAGHPHSPRPWERLASRVRAFPFCPALPTPVGTALGKHEDTRRSPLVMSPQRTSGNPIRSPTRHQRRERREPAPRSVHPRWGRVRRDATTAAQP